MRALFISDLHLSDTDAATHQRFLAFVRGPARAAQRLYILGDLFHHWLGDAQLGHDAYAKSVATELSTLSALPCEIRLLVGNRDFMIGRAFARRIGATLLDGPTVETLGDQRVVVLHGDELCTDDVRYQRARAVLRHPLFKLAVAPLPFFARHWIAQYLRRKSGAYKKTLATHIMDVTEHAVLETFSRFDVTLMVHGHTHRPTGDTPHQHIHLPSRQSLFRHVLDDWQFGAGYTQWENGVFTHHPWPS